MNRLPCTRRLAVSLLCLHAALPAVRAAEEDPVPPPYYAIRDVRVATGNGSVVERTTVLLADGLIEAIGPGLAIPQDAWVIDGDGLTLFPGLIDGLTTLGLPVEEESSRGSGPAAGGRGEGPPPPRGPQDRPQTTPWRSPAELLVDDDTAVEKWRRAGFTAAAVAPADGLFSGQASLVHLGRAEPAERVLATPIAQRLGFRGGGFRSYPGSLMGVLSYIRQVLLDSRHYTAVKALYREAPLGRERPAFDRSLEPLERALADRLPFLLPADSAAEIDRALALAGDQKLPAVLYGGQGAYRRVAQLRAARTPVLVSLDWPEEEKDRDPDADTPFRVLAHRRLAPSTPAALAAAGVPFAFTSGGLSTPDKVFAGLRRAIAEGLSAQAALTALTANAAEIYRVDERLGTIAPGKIANLVLATAEPWVEDVEIRAVFVDGRRYTERQSAEPTEAPAADVSGTWELTLETPRGSREMKATLEMKPDGKVTGELVSERGSSSLDEGRMGGDLLRFKVTREMGGRSMQASYSLTIEGESASGTMSAGAMTMDLAGTRTKRPSEEPAAATDAEPSVSLDELRAALAVLQGPVRPGDSFAITHARVYTVSGETIEDGTVVVRDGVIRAVGESVEVPPGVEVIDAAGGSLIPGIIDAHSHIAVEGGVNEGSLAVSSMVSVGDVLDPDDIAIYRALAGGVTTANILHGSANPIGGQNAVIKLRWGSDAAGLRFAGAPPGIKFALGENPKRSNRSGSGPPRYPQSRMGVMDVIRQAFVEARQAQQEQQRYRQALARKERPTPPRRDLRLEPLVEILEGKRLVHAHCYRADEILQLLRLAEELGFRVATLQHVLEGYKVADEIAAHGAGGSTFSDWWGYKIEAYDAIPQNAALMTERGVVVSINSDSAEEMRHLNQEAAKTMRWGGLDELAALRLVTLNPALQLGIAGRVGSIEVGKDADLVLYDGPPLAVRSVVQKTFVDGVLLFDRHADRERQATIEDLERRLAGKTDGEEEEATAEQEEPTSESVGTSPPERRWDEVRTYSCQEVSR